MFRAREALYTPLRLGVWRARPILLFALVMVGVVLGPPIASAQLLNLSWIDNSRSQASSIIQRAPSSAGGINCGIAYSYTYSTTTEVTLTGTSQQDPRSAAGPAEDVSGLTRVVWPEMDS